jgi:hypothetical protein
MKKFTWSRSGGYQVSSQGDRRFSAFYAIMPDGRTLECHYQCDTKGFDPGGVNWKLGKGKSSLRKDVNLLKEYVALWTIWASNNMALMRELYFLAKDKNYVLSDCFATTEVNQANALAIVLNDLIANSTKNHETPS